MIGYVDNDTQKIRNMTEFLLSPALRRPAEDLEDRLLFGSVDDCIQKINSLHEAGVIRIHI